MEDSKNKRIPFCGFDGKSLEEIKKTLGFEVEIAVYIAKDENNCFATIGTGGKKVLIADLNFLDDVNKRVGTQWAAISILAHEVGHHIESFGRHESSLDDELDADYWSGYILMKLGASRDASIKCIMRYGTEHDTNSHPNRYTRASTIGEGWDDAYNGTIDYSKCENCEPDSN
jgi:hypothetical protein